MTTITLQTLIKATPTLVFDLSRDIDLHMKSASHTHERAIAGTTSGLIGYGETVTWRGKHFGLFLTHTSKIIDFEKPLKFTDIMIKGHFKYFAHQHIFKQTSEGVLMIDILKYRLPYYFLGTMVDRLLINTHLTSFLKTRNNAIKIVAEEHSS